MEISTGFLKAFHAGKNFGKSDFAAPPPKKKYSSYSTGYTTSASKTGQYWYI